MGKKQYEKALSYIGMALGLLGTYTLWKYQTYDKKLKCHFTMDVC